MNNDDDWKVDACLLGVVGLWVIVVGMLGWADAATGAVADTVGRWGLCLAALAAVWSVGIVQKYRCRKMYAAISRDIQLLRDELMQPEGLEEQPRIGVVK